MAEPLLDHDGTTPASDESKVPTDADISVDFANDSIIADGRHLGREFQQAGPKRSPEACAKRRFIWSLVIGIPLFILLIFCPPYGVFWFLYLPAMYSGTWGHSVSGSEGFGCDAMGKVMYGDASPMFDTRYTFAITVSLTGRLGFAAVKAIDICWDLGLGRGGQAFLAWCTYHVFRRAMLTRSHPCILSYSQYTTLTYAPDTVLALGVYVRDYSSQVRRRVRDRMSGSLALIFCTIYLLVFPTWTSAMTGYQAVMSSYVTSNSTNDLLMPMSAIKSCELVLQESADATLQCLNPVQARQYTTDHSVYYGENSTTTQSKPQYSCRSSDGPGGFDCQVVSPEDGSTRNVTESIKIWTYDYAYDSTHEYYFYDDQATPRDVLVQRGICQPQPGYQWGFSGILLSAFVVTTLGFVLILYIIWVRGIGRGHRGRVEDTFGALTTAVKIASHLHAEIGSFADGMSERDLRKAVEATRSDVRPGVKAEASGNYNPNPKQSLPE